MAAGCRAKGVAMTTEFLVFLSFLVIMSAPIMIMAFESACAYLEPRHDRDRDDDCVCCVGKEEDCG